MTNVEKLMAITRGEFETGVARMTGAPARQNAEGRYLLTPEGAAHPVTGAFEPQPDAVLGKLMRLPRVRVTLDLSALPEGERSAFVLKFDRIFQRGGG